MRNPARPKVASLTTHQTVHRQKIFYHFSHLIYPMRHSIAYFLNLFFVLLLGGGLSATSQAQGVSDHISREIIRNITGATGQNIEARLFIPELRVKQSAGGIKGIRLSADGNLLVAVPSDGTVRIWDLTAGVQRLSFRPQGDVEWAVPTSNGANVIVTTNEGPVHLYDAVSGRRSKTLELRKRDIKNLSVSPDSKLVIWSGSGSKLRIWDLDDTSRKRELGKLGGRISSLVFSRSGRLLAAATHTGEMYVVDAVSGRVKMKASMFSDRILSVQFAESEDFLIATANSGKVAILDLASGKVTARFNGPKDVRSFAVSPDMTLVAFGTEGGSIRIYKIPRGKEWRHLEAHSDDVTGLSFIGDMIVSAGRDGLIRIWDIELGESLLRIILTSTGWAVVDRQGRFDGSEQGLNEIVWHARGEELGFDQFADQFFEPGLLATHVSAGQQFGSLAPGRLQDGMPLPPLVEIELPDQHRNANQPFQVIAIATSRGNSIETIRLYHNGKLVQPGSFLQQQDFVDGETEIRAAAFQVKPVAGINSFRAMATGLWGVEGRSDQRTEKFGGPTSPAPRLHIVAVALNEYRDARLNLGYSVPDAQSIIDAFKNGAGSAYSDVIVHRLFDADATKQNILGMLKRLSGTSPEDVVVFYYAGHGIATNEDWVLLPYEVRVDKTSKSYTDQGVSANRLQAELVQARAHRILVMIDSCYSGTGVQTFEKMQSFQRRYLNKFSRLAGITVLAATRRDQKAVELSSLGSRRCGPGARAPS